MHAIVPLCRCFGPSQEALKFAEPSAAQVADDQLPDLSLEGCLADEHCSAEVERPDSFAAASCTDDGAEALPLGDEGGEEASPGAPAAKLLACAIAVMRA